jgi:hypothetical protein
MATKKTQKSGAQLKGLAGASKQALSPLVEQGHPIQVIGRVVNGKLEIDQASLAEFSRRFPNAKMTFVAVNAPFDPVPYSSN